MCVNVLAKAFSKFQPTGVLSAVLQTGSAFPRETLAPFFMSRSSSLTRRPGLRCEAVRPRPHSAPAYSRRVKTNARQCRGPQHDGSGPGSPPHGREVGKCRWPRFSVSTRFRGGIPTLGDTINC